MKKQLVIVLCILSFSTTVAIGQFRKIPAGVTDAFKNKYPDATEVSWSDKISAFQASFTLNNEKLEADFSSKGVWKKTSKELNITNLPTAIDEGFKSSKYHTDWTLKSAIETQKEDLSYEYRLLIEKSALQKKYLYFNQEGKLLREAVTL